MEKLKPCPQEAEALDIIESLLDVADMKCTGPLYADAPPRSGMCRIPEDDAIKLRQYIADRRAAPENKPLTFDELRGMDGEPVWVREMAVWALVATCGTSIWLRFSTGDAKYIGSTDGYEIYARRPEAAK